MRRWLLIGGTLAAALATGCGSGSDSGQPAGDAGTPPVAPQTQVTIAFLQHGNPDYDTANGAAFRAYERAHPNVTIQTTTVEFETLTATLLADLKNDRLNADLLQVPGNWVCSFAANLADVPAEVVTMAAAQTVFFDAPLKGGTCAGVMKGVPVEYNLEYGGVVVNVDKFRARFPGRTPAWVDWTSFIADAAALAEFDGATPKANGLDIDPNWPGPVVYIFFAQILQRGGQYWAPSGDRLDLMTQAARDAVTDMTNWITRDKVMSLSLIPDRPDIFVATRLARGATGTVSSATAAGRSRCRTPAATRVSPGTSSSPWRSIRRR
jgi:multiple sugar transport system substrate-binding protein